MKAQKKSMAVIVGGAFAATLAMSPVVHADQNPFATKSLSSGYQVADSGEKMKEGKCSEGKCSSTKKKAKEGKCSSGEKMKEGKCSSGEKMKEGKCSSGEKS